jgi:hypothetical protein
MFWGKLCGAIIWAEYLSALDRASIDLDPKPFAAFIGERVNL